ncbi:TPA: TIR domain-containing protein [Stenotrophomonas maltophilia]
MARKVFFSFHYQLDAWRAATVRQIGAIEGNASAKDNDWETIKGGGERAIKTWIDSQLDGRTCTVVLVGEETAQRKWVRYEIEESWRRGMGVLGVRIHRLLNSDKEPGKAGANPFDYVKHDGRPLSRLVTLHDPLGIGSQTTYSSISSNLKTWIEQAIQARK